MITFEFLFLPDWRYQTTLLFERAGQVFWYQWCGRNKTTRLHKCNCTLFALFFRKQCLRSSQSLSRILLWFWNKISRHLWSTGEFQLYTRSRLCPGRKKAMVGEGEKKSKREISLPLVFFPPSLPLRHSGYTRPKSLCHSANMETKIEKDKVEVWS